MRHRPLRPSRRRIVALAGLLLCSALLFVLPRGPTAFVRGLVQLLLPFQHASTAVGDAMFAVDDRARTGLDASEHRLAALSLRVQDLEDQVRLLTATRLWNVDGQGIRSTGRLIPAQVVAGDILPWRDSLLLNTGRLQGVAPGAIVATDRFVIDRGESLGLHEGMAVLLGEMLLGWIDELHAEASRVRCLSDPAVEMKVRVGRLTKDGFASADGHFWLVGRGRGQMQIRDLDHRLVQDGAIEIGDLVVSDAAAPLLAFPMVVGRVRDIQPNRENPLLDVVTVGTAMEGATPRRVYVFDASAPPVDGVDGAPDR